MAGPFVVTWLPGNPLSPRKPGVPATHIQSCRECWLSLGSGYFCLLSLVLDGAKRLVYRDPPPFFFFFFSFFFFFLKKTPPHPPTLLLVAISPHSPSPLSALCKVVSCFAVAVLLLWCEYFFSQFSLVWEGKLRKRLGEGRGEWKKRGSVV